MPRFIARRLLCPKAGKACRLSPLSIVCNGSPVMACPPTNEVRNRFGTRRIPTLFCEMYPQYCVALCRDLPAVRWRSLIKQLGCQAAVGRSGLRFSLRVNELANGRRSWIQSRRRLSECSVNQSAGAASVRTTVPISKYDGAPPEGVVLSFT